MAGLDCIRLMTRLKSQRRRKEAEGSFPATYQQFHSKKRKNSEVCEMQNDMREGIEEGLKGRMRIEPDEAEIDMMMGMSELERT